jgi:hypothetical protein
MKALAPRLDDDMASDAVVAIVYLLGPSRWVSVDASEHDGTAGGCDRAEKGPAAGFGSESARRKTGAGG